jgi:DNA-binding XRE family transcriptional regulator
LAEYIRKHRKEKRLTIKELAREIGVHEFTLINWEVRGRTPRFKSHIGTLKRIIPEVARFFENSGRRKYESDGVLSLVEGRLNGSKKAEPENRR